MNIRLTYACLPILLASLFCLVFEVEADVILDFDSLTDPNGDGQVDRGSSYTENGFTLTAPSPAIHYSIHPGFSLYAGSVSMYNSNEDGLSTIANASGEAFNLLSIDLGRLTPDRPGELTVAFTGTQAGGGEVTQSFIVSAPFGSFETFSFSSNFSNLQSVTWNQDFPNNQFDNIVLSIVPEPSTWAVMGLGGLALAGGDWQRRRKARR